MGLGTWESGCGIVGLLVQRGVLSMRLKTGGVLAACHGLQIKRIKDCVISRVVLGQGEVALCA